MKQDKLLKSFPADDNNQTMVKALPVTASQTKENQCNYRTPHGYCIRSNRQCPATFSTIILHT